MRSLISPMAKSLAPLFFSNQYSLTTCGTMSARLLEFLNATTPRHRLNSTSSSPYISSSRFAAISAALWLKEYLGLSAASSMSPSTSWRDRMTYIMSKKNELRARLSPAVGASCNGRFLRSMCERVFMRSLIFAIASVEWRYAPQIARRDRAFLQRGRSVFGVTTPRYTGHRNPQQGDQTASPRCERASHRPSRQGVRQQILTRKGFFHSRTACCGRADTRKREAQAGKQHFETQKAFARVRGFYESVVHQTGNRFLRRYRGHCRRV